MNIPDKLNQFHSRAKSNKWLGYFAVFNRVALALGFLPSGFVKIMGERFTSLAVNQPMGNYLEALHHTGYYYTFIGVAQILAALLLLIPRTVVLGAFLYFPIILNICILSIAVRFEGSLISSPLMVLSNLYVLLWYYDRWKNILPFNHAAKTIVNAAGELPSNKFPVLFFAGVTATVAIVVITLTNVFEIMPRNAPGDCKMQCDLSKNSKACNNFCNCIHTKGQPLNKCLDAYNKALENTK